MSEEKEITFRSIPEWGDCMTIEEWESNCRTRSFIDSDGSGYFAKNEKRSNVTASPSSVTRGDSPPDWATHVVWFNK